jgi:diaminopimelate decarboxylase
LRVNPDVDPHTHAYITTGKKETKFGLDLETTARLLKSAARYKNLVVAGLHAHIGSQITEVEPYRESLKKVVGFILEHRSEAAPLTHLNSGGGFGIYYKDRSAPPVERFARAMLPAIRASGCTLLLEPGRFICGNAGILVTRITYVKHSGRKRFLIVDAGMNDLVRPSLYGSFHEIWPVQGSGPSPTRGGNPPPKSCAVDVVGPICESGDFLAKDRPLPKDLKSGDLLAVFSAGAYGRTMSSNYNTRLMAPEIVVNGSTFAVATRRQTYADVLACERVPKGI